jgi:D-alanyl-lipoteichoic acid acyltransferase DltB (MBOAT superfamily)
VLNSGTAQIRALSIIATFLFVCFGWVLFAASSAVNAAAIYAHLLGH